jgi:hypothetical protein
VAAQAQLAVLQTVTGSHLSSMQAAWLPCPCLPLQAVNASDQSLFAYPQQLWHEAGVKEALSRFEECKQ